jgi:hypothetical protein
MKSIVVFAIIVVLIGVAIGGILYGQRVANQEPTKVYNSTTAEPVDGSKSTPETSQIPPQGGHFHDDGTWHAGPHESTDAIGQTQAQETAPPKYKPLKTHEDLREYLRTATPEEIYARNRDMYIARHYKKYPDYTEHEAVVADAERQANWFIVDMEYEKIEAVARAEYKSVSEAILELPSDYNEIISMTDVEKKALAAKALDLHKRHEIASKRYDEVIQQRPLPLKPKHTH